MDGDLKKLRFRFPGVGKRDKGGGQTSSVTPQGNTALMRAQMDSDGEYNAAFAATIAAAAYAIAAREEKLAAQKKTIPVEAPTIGPPARSSIKRGESMKKPTGGSKISRWFSGKEPAEGDDEGPVNVSVRRPLKPTQRKPEATGSDQKVTLPLPLPLPPRMLDSSASGKKATRKGARGLSRSRQFRRHHPPAVSPATSYHSRRDGDGTAGVTAIARTETKADSWERAKLARIREEHEKMMNTIAEWESEKKVKVKAKLCQVWVLPECPKLLLPLLSKLRLVNLLNLPEGCDIAWTMFFLEAAPSLEELSIMVWDHWCKIMTDKECREEHGYCEKANVEWQPSASDFKHKNLAKLTIYGFQPEDSFVQYVRRVMEAALNIQEISLHDRKACESCRDLDPKIKVVPSRYPRTVEEKDLLRDEITKGLEIISPDVIIHLRS